MELERALRIIRYYSDYKYPEDSFEVIEEMSDYFEASKLVDEFIDELHEKRIKNIK